MRHKNKRYTAPDRVEFGYSFQIGEGLWERMGVDVSLKPGETIEGKLSEMQERLMQFHKKTNPQLYSNGKEALVSSFGISNRVASWAEENPKVINRLHERIELLIEDCKTIEQLLEYKKDLPNELLPAYVKKFEELTNIKSYD